MIYEITWPHEKEETKERRNKKLVVKSKHNVVFNLFCSIVFRGGKLLAFLGKKNAKRSMIRSSRD